MKTLFLIVTLSFVNYLNAEVENFSLDNTDGQRTEFNEIKGEKLTVIDFWATWCKPCVNSIPKLNKLAQETKEKGVGFIGINVDSPRNISKVKPFVQALGVSYPVLLDTDEEVMTQLNVSVLPTLLIVNSKNEIVFTHEGFKPGDEVLIKEEIEKILSEK